MSSGDGFVGSQGDNYSLSKGTESSEESQYSVIDGEIIFWRGAINKHIAKVRGEKLVSPTIPEGPCLIRAGKVIKSLDGDEIIGLDNEGMVHVMDGDTVIVYDDEGEIVATQSLHSYKTKLWLQYVKSEHGWESLARKYAELGAQR